MGKLNDNVLAEADTLIQVWNANPTLAMGELTKPMVEAKVNELRAKDTLVDETQTLLTRLRDEANAVRSEVEQIITRGRSGVRAAFGTDSPQYDQVGGTPDSKRKPRSGNKKGGGEPST